MKDCLNFFSAEPSPLQSILPGVFGPLGIELWIKRDDQLHPQVSGNKWRKLKYNLLEAERMGYDRLITFGGAYSNHLAAVAAAGKALGIRTLGVVRGEKTEPLNPTLCSCEASGMALYYVSRANFRKKSYTLLLSDLKISMTGAYLLPEGGTNCLALPGCREIVDELKVQRKEFPDFVIVPCGTGGTLAGIVSGLPPNAQALGVSVLKDGFLQMEVKQLLNSCSCFPKDNWRVLNDYHFGGYAKFTPELISFMQEFSQQTKIPLDPVYSGKMAYAVFDLAKKGFFSKGAVVAMVHTGGLQGNAGFSERYGIALNT
jgi:1-aminocyclopropane-1-carboxylate deaminase/D-cysteine desulfhydrase-like pyridoxal-dependent ACC family enzyme